jgi:ketosteroid isomerase-like protein
MRTRFPFNAVCLAVLLASLLAGCAAPAPHASVEELKRQVADTERAFAKTMADRDHTAFASFLSDEAIFFSGKKNLHGKQEVAAAWKPLYQKPEAPFSWEPEQVEVLDSGTLALSTGPVRDAKGNVFAIYSSIWRQESPGVWRIIFDKGSDVCDCPKP